MPIAMVQKIPRTYSQCALISTIVNLYPFSGKLLEKRLIWMIGQCIILPHSPHWIARWYKVLSCAWDQISSRIWQQGDAE